MRGLVIATLLASLSTTAHAGGAAKAKVRAVIDRTVGGKVVSRTVVTGTLPRKPKRQRGIEQELSAARKGWSVTEEAAPAPSDLTLKGRLEESGYRAQRRGQSILELSRPGGQHLKGEQEIHIYQGGRRTRIRRLPKVADRAVDGAEAGVRRGTGEWVRVVVHQMEFRQGSSEAATWTPAQAMAFRYQPEEPYSVTFQVGGGTEWVFGRELLADALATGRSGDGDVRLRVRGEHLEIKLRSPEGTAVLRMGRRDAITFLRQSERSVPRGNESAYLDLDGGLHRILGAQ